MNAEHFTFSPSLPLAATAVPWATALGYAAITYFLRQANVRASPSAGAPASKRTVSLMGAAHNLALCSISLFLFSGTLRQLLAHPAPHSLVCIAPDDHPGGRLYWLATLYYYSKFLELGDTALLLLKGHAPSFLHVFHHALVIPMAHMWPYHRMSTFPFALLANTSVHVPMYFYYFLSQVQRLRSTQKPSWGSYITMCQIVQFAVSFAFFAGMLLEHFYLSPHRCSGFAACLYNVSFNGALFALFFDVFKQKRDKPSASKKKEEAIPSGKANNAMQALQQSQQQQEQFSLHPNGSSTQQRQNSGRVRRRESY
jgi:hypothetical protein